jgi:3-oxoacyl-[acyl-carrier protein] reductase
MSGRTVIITGGTKGLGRELSLDAARQGDCPIALYHHDAAAAAQLEADLAAESLAGRAVRHDVTNDDPNAAVWAAPEIVNAGALALIHNASAAFVPTPFHLLRWSDFEYNLQVALKGAWACARAVLRPMLARGRGTIVTVLSTALTDSPKGFAAYVAAKSALRGLTESLAAEYAARGIKVLSVSPGFMRTPLTDAWHPAMRQAVMGNTEASDPARVAARIRTIMRSDAVPGRGENHAV